MSTCRFTLRCLGCLGGLLAAAAGVRAAALEITSPFLSASAAPVAVVTTGAPIELHGYMMTPEGEKFSIYDPAKKSATWVKVNETGYPFVVRSYKVENSTDQITVDYQGSTITLALKQSKIASAVPAAGPAQAFAGRPGGPPTFGTTTARPNSPPQSLSSAETTALEAARLQAAAIDFQQRQAQRQQAQAAMQAGQVPQMVAPAGQQGQRATRANGGQQQNNGAARRAGRGQ